MDWSYDLLGEAERTLFNRLAVFAGSFLLEAVEAICAGEIGSSASAAGILPSQVLDLLGALVDNSLVSVQERNDNTRYILLETVRQYALEKLQASGEFSHFQNQHLKYYLGVAQEGKSHAWVGEQVWINRFENEYDNFRAAMEYAIATNLESAILLEDSLGMFTDLTCRNREAYGWAMHILALTDTWPPSILRAKALELAGWQTWVLSVNRSEDQKGHLLAEASFKMATELDDKIQIKESIQNLESMSWTHGDWLQLHIYAEQYLAISRELGDKVGIQEALYSLGESISQIGDKQTGRMYLEQSIEMARQENFPNGLAFALEALARIARLEGDNTTAIELYTECAQIRRKMGHLSGLAHTLYNLGQVALQEGDAVQARALFEEMLSIYSELQSIEGQGLYPLAMAGVAAQTGHDERAVRLFGATESNAERTDSVMNEISHQVFDPLVAAIRERLGEEEFKQL